VIETVRRASSSVRLTAVLIGMAAMSLSLSLGAATGEYRWRLPRGFPQPAVPAENPMSDAKVSLGARLFADRRLSVDGSYSCQSCHVPERAFTDGRGRSRGVTGAELALNAPTLLNAAYNASLGWNDVGIFTLEQQMRGPLFNQHPPELGLAGRESRVESEFAADPELAPLFMAAFPGEARAVSMDNVIRAIAAYERTLLAGNSAFDRYVFAGDHEALDARQKRGMQLFFGNAGCSGCHGGINFAGPWVDRDHPRAAPIFADTGTGKNVRVPTLRNLPASAPFMHDGRFATLDAVLDHYERLAADPAADARLRRAPLTTEERAELAAFLQALSDSR
jgi:cytochrome c peroxidase